MSKTRSAKLPSEVAITNPKETSEKTKPATLDLQVLYNFVKDEIIFFIKCNNHCIKKLQSEINHPLWIYCNVENISMLTNDYLPQNATCAKELLCVLLSWILCCHCVIFNDFFSLKQQFKTDQQQSYRVTLSMPTPSFELSFKHIRREVPSATRYERGPTDKNANIFWWFLSYQALSC